MDVRLIPFDRKANKRDEDERMQLSVERGIQKVPGNGGFFIKDFCLQEKLKCMTSISINYSAAIAFNIGTSTINF